MLNAGREQGYFWEEALVGRTSHDLMRVPLRPAIWANDNDCWAKVLEEVPASAGDSEDVRIRADIAENFKCGVMLEEKIHLYAYTANILKHV